METIGRAGGMRPCNRGGREHDRIFNEHPLLKRIFDRKDSMTPRNRVLADFILRNPAKWSS